MTATLEAGPPRTLPSHPPVPASTRMAGDGARLLAGPPLDGHPEGYGDHRARLGRRPVGGDWTLEVLERSGLRGRGGGWFPAARKWAGIRALADRAPAVVVVNLSEGEPLSAKDRTLALHRPHLILDGAQIAAETVGAEEVVICVAGPARALLRALRAALGERRKAGAREVPVAFVRSPHRYVAGESSAVVRRSNGGPARPAFSPLHPPLHGVGGRPTLVQNAETLAHSALVARFGDAWYRQRGSPGAPGTMLLTLSGAVRRPGVVEVEVGAPLAGVIRAAGGAPDAATGVLVGGYAGTWCNPAQVREVRLSPECIPLGCGVVGVLGAEACGLSEAARIVTYLARESAGQCGPCVHGLRAVAETLQRVAASDADTGDVERLLRWARMIAGRGACHHPDGAVANVRSALEAFAGHLPLHLSGIPCSGHEQAALPPPPGSGWHWR